MKEEFKEIIKEIFDDVNNIKAMTFGESTIKNKAIISIREALAKRNMSDIIG